MRANAIAPAHPAAARLARSQRPGRILPSRPSSRWPELAAKINTGSDENKKPSAGAAGSSAHKYSRKKVVDTLTSVLTARSKSRNQIYLWGTIRKELLSPTSKKIKVGI